MVPCYPFLYGAIAVPGQSYWPSGFGSQHCSVNGPMLGHIIAPTNVVLGYWASELLQCWEGDYRPDGGFSPLRTFVCVWGGQNELYYKAESQPCVDALQYMENQYDLVVEEASLTENMVRHGYDLMMLKQTTFEQIFTQLVQNKMLSLTDPEKQQELREFVQDWVAYEDIVKEQVLKDRDDLLATMV